MPCEGMEIRDRGRGPELSRNNKGCTGLGNLNNRICISYYGLGIPGLHLILVTEKKVSVRVDSAPVDRKIL